MLFNEIDNFIQVYNNSVIELVVFWDLVLRSDWSPRKLGDQFPTKELGPKHCIRSITYNYQNSMGWWDEVSFHYCYGHIDDRQKPGAGISSYCFHRRHESFRCKRPIKRTIGSFARHHAFDKHFNRHHWYMSAQQQPTQDSNPGHTPYVCHQRVRSQKKYY